MDANTGARVQVEFETNYTESVPNRAPQSYYSRESWTVVRGPRARRPPDRVRIFCRPNCGAPLAINMAGECAHCRAKVSSAEFDWVLSRIEQDETYRG